MRIFHHSQRLTVILRMRKMKLTSWKTMKKMCSNSVKILRKKLLNVNIQFSPDQQLKMKKILITFMKRKDMFIFQIQKYTKMNTWLTTKTITQSKFFRWNLTKRNNSTLLKTQNHLVKLKYKESYWNLLLINQLTLQLTSKSIVTRICIHNQVANRNFQNSITNK